MENNEPIIEHNAVSKNNANAQDETLQKALKAIDNGTLTMEQKEYLRDKFMGRDSDYQKLSGQEKADQLLREWEKSLIDNMPNLEASKKEFYDKTHAIEIDESKDKIQNTHINIKHQKVRLIISSEGGRVITVNNQEALEEYRTAVQNGGKEKIEEKAQSNILHNSRQFS